MFLQSLLGHFVLVEDQLRNPLALHDAIVCTLVVLGADELRYDGLEFVAVRLQRSVADVHLVRGEAEGKGVVS